MNRLDETGRTALGAPAPRPHVMRLHVLASGSKGNCALVEAPDGLIMVDAGLSRRETLARMHALGLDEHRVRALIVTHEHTDHVGGVPVWHRAFPVDLYASAGTPEARAKLDGLPFRELSPDGEEQIAGVRVRAFATSHDVVNPIGLHFSCKGDAIGYVTDTGIMPSRARRMLCDARILALESNHDIPMLRCGDYPRNLQDRIASDRGHLSNEQAAEAACQLVGPRTEQLVAMHISQENNRPSLAVRALAGALGATLDDELGSSATLDRDGELPALRIRAAGQNRPITLA